MDTSTSADGRIEIGLEALRLMIADLPEVAAEWDELSDGERASWSLDWDQLMGSYLYLLDKYYRSQQLTPDQQVRYCTILRRLRESMALIDELQLFPPPVPLEA
jgi:hypothetical protein